MKPNSAGYSGTPLARKLGVKSGHVLELIGAPEGWRIDSLPKGVRVMHVEAAVTGEIVVAFFRDLHTVLKKVPELAQALAPAGALWVAWPRRAGGHSSDITENAIRDVVLPLGLVDVKVAALDNDWSGLKVVWRKENRRPR